jgi:hypothetical protein
MNLNYHAKGNHIVYTVLLFFWTQRSGNMGDGNQLIASKKAGSCPKKEKLTLYLSACSTSLFLTWLE